MGETYSFLEDEALRGYPIIDGAGKYVTRGGKVVEVFGRARRGIRWQGHYCETGISEQWLSSGRMFVFIATENDIVSKYHGSSETA